MENGKLVCTILCPESSRDLGFHFQNPDSGFAGIVMVGHALVVEESEEEVAALDDTVL